MNGKMTKCNACGADIAKNAKICPQCGTKNKRPLIVRWWFWAIIVVVALGVKGTFNDTNSTNVNSSVSQTSPAGSGVESKVPVVSEELTFSVEKSESPEDNVPAEYRSALRKATSYSDAMNMSRIGVYNQLTSEYGEKFSQEAAQYAIDNIKADWKANALAKADSYADTMNMSKIGVYDQLTSESGEQFTEEEAQYAIDNVQADWEANALVKAKSYQESMDMSPSSIRDQLVSEYGEKFTPKEADYAIQHLND